MITESVDGGLSCGVLGQGLAPRARCVAGSHAWTHFLMYFWAHPSPQVSSRVHRKIWALPFQESMALRETCRPWRMSKHAVWGCVSRSASCRLCNWEEMLLLLLTLTSRQAAAKRGNFSPFSMQHPIMTSNARTLFLIQGTRNTSCWELERGLGRYCLALASCSLQAFHYHSSRKLGIGQAKLLPCPRTTNLFLLFLLRSHHGGKAEDKFYPDS